MLDRLKSGQQTVHAERGWVQIGDWPEAVNALNAFSEKDQDGEMSILF